MKVKSVNVTAIDRLARSAAEECASSGTTNWAQGVRGSMCVSFCVCVRVCVYRREPTSLKRGFYCAAYLTAQGTYLRPQRHGIPKKSQCAYVRE